MAVFGYIVYIIICLWVSLICLGVFSWPSSGKGERWASVIVFSLLWFGAYHWSPFSVNIT